jgi:hypothetical protein
MKLKEMNNQSFWMYYERNDVDMFEIKEQLNWKCRYIMVSTVKEKVTQPIDNSLLTSLSLLDFSVN